MEKKYIFNISPWKQSKLKPFLKKESITFMDSSEIDKLENNAKSIYLWGKKEEYKEIEAYAKKHNISLSYIEDGFIRSVSLGVDFSQPYSLVIDSRGIYYDPTTLSDLEYILLNRAFDSNLLERANKLKRYLVENRLSKYNIYKDKRVTLNKTNQDILLVIGQVEGDASLVYGANNMKNIELLKEVKKSNPNSYIIYKPHPDVLKGSRKGNIEDGEALNYCHQIEKEVSIDSLLSICDEVHTMTSLVGFEALLRGKKVVCYGKPFYAGWGLTTDMRTFSSKRKELTLDELVAGAYILYPKYIDPKTLDSCEIEDLLEALAVQKERYHNGYFYRTYIKVESFFRKKYYAILRHTIYRNKS